MSIEAKVRELEAVGDSRWAWTHYLDTVRELIALSNAKSVIEIGGGRSPSFSEADVAALGIDYTSNDISERELARAPEWVGKAHFDVQSPDPHVVAPFECSFDFAFSKMVMEHVASYERAYANIHRILRPGGISIAFHPVLFAFPFVVNKLIPEAASARILKAMFPNRTDNGIPKFPAFYSGCMISRAVRERLRRIGFTDVWQIPFYGHTYYGKMPVVRDIHARITDALAKHRVDALATFAFTIAVK